MICMQKWCQNCQVCLIWHTFFTKTLISDCFFIKKWCQNSLSTEGTSEFKVWPSEFKPDPLNLRSDPLNLRSGPLNLRSDPLNLRTGARNLRIDPVSLRFCSRTCNKVLVTFEGQTNYLTTTLHNSFGCSHQQKTVTQSRQHIDRIWPVFLVGSHVCAFRFTRRPI